MTCQTAGYRIFTVFLISSILAACAGRVANPSASYRIGDDAMSCSEIKAELSHVQSRVDALVPESEKTGKNVALGVAGWFLIVPWFFMDLSKSEQVEIKAYQERYLSLEKLYSRKDCANEQTNSQEKGNSAQGEKSSELDRNDPKARLIVLKKLLEQGLISDDEYNAQRLEVIKEI